MHREHTEAFVMRTLLYSLALNALPETDLLRNMNVKHFDQLPQPYSHEVDDVTLSF